MSSDLINIRIGSYHLHIERGFRIRVGRNDYHKQKGWPDGYFAVYQFFGYSR
jgi:hypothetical protein